MADLLIELNGIKGLAPGYTTYPEFETARPNLVAFGEDQNYAGGVVNPFRRPGFMGPANDLS